ncbi:MAG: hypothetical protein Q7J55_00320 [bacterium]|nr:hypothetical protein [bacterium]
MKVNIHKDLKKIITEEKLAEKTLISLVQQIFSDCTSLNLHSFSKHGFSGAILSVAQGIRTIGNKTIVCIMKISHKNDIKREFKNYTKYVKGCLDHSYVPAIYGDAPKYKGGWGAIAYSKVGGGGKDPLQFGELYADAEIPQLTGILDMLFNGLMHPWIEPRQFHQGELSWKNAYHLTQDKTHSIQDNYSFLCGNSEYHKYMEVRVDPIEYYKNLGSDSIPNAVLTVSHGDLNGANILFKRNDRRNPWLIDFAHTGYGHYLRDFAKLEADIKFGLMDRTNKDALDRLPYWLEMDNVLNVLPFGEPSYIPPYVLIETDPEILKAYSVIRHLRSLAFDRMIGDKESHIAQYRAALFLYTLQTLSFRDISPCKKIFAFRSASRLCQFIKKSRPPTVMSISQTSPNFLMYLGQTGDESWHKGDNIEKRYYGIVGLIFPHRLYTRKFAREAQNLIIKHQIPLEFNFRDKPKEDYNNAIISLLQDSRFTLIGIVIDKYIQAYRDPDTRGNFYACNLQTILTLFCEYLNLQEKAKAIRVGTVIGPFIGPFVEPQPSRSREAYSKLLDQGTKTRSPIFFRHALIAKNLTERLIWPYNLTEEKMKENPLTLSKCKELKISDFLGLKLANVLAKIVEMDILIENHIISDYVEEGDKKVSEKIKEKYWKNPLTRETIGFGKVLIK